MHPDQLELVRLLEQDSSPAKRSKTMQRVHENKVTLLTRGDGQNGRASLMLVGYTHEGLSLWLSWRWGCRLSCLHTCAQGEEIEGVAIKSCKKVNHHDHVMIDDK